MIYILYWFGFGFTVFVGVSLFAFFVRKESITFEDILLSFFYIILGPIILVPVALAFYDEYGHVVVFKVKK